VYIESRLLIGHSCVFPFYFRRCAVSLSGQAREEDSARHNALKDSGRKQTVRIAMI